MSTSLTSVGINFPDNTTTTTNLIPSGARMLFYQASAPTGWTQLTSINDRMLRVVSGNGGSTGGSWTISGLNVQGHSLSTSQMPSHSHGGSTNTTGNHSHSGSTSTTGNHRHFVGGTTSGAGQGQIELGGNSTETNRNTNYAGNHSHSLSINSNGNHNHSLSINNSGGGNSHSHGISHNGNWRPRYADVIICEKD